MEDELIEFKEKIRRLWCRYRIAVDNGDYSAARFAASELDNLLEIDDYGEL